MILHFTADLTYFRSFTGASVALELEVQAFVYSIEADLLLSLSE